MKLRWTRAALLPLAPAAGVLLAVAGAGPVHAIGTNLSVTGLLDGAGACVGTVCPTLRAAVLQANGDSGDTITLGAGTYSLSGSLPIESAMNITGAGANKTTIQQTQCGTRVLTIDPDGTKLAQKPVNVTGVTLTGGSLVGKELGFSSGGGVLVTDGALVTLNHDVISHNTSNGNGGGISVHKDDSTLVVLDTVIKNNTAGAGITCEESSPSPSPSVATPDIGSLSLMGNGGGLWAEGVVTMHSSTVNNNWASGNGGGVLLSPPPGATDTLSQVFIHHNTAAGGVESIDSGGGGIYDELVPGAHVAIDHSTISNNIASNGNGGGDYEDFSSLIDVAKVATLVSAPLVTISSTTFNGNTATGWPGLGGALYVHDGANVLTTNDTITNNTARNGGGIAVGQATVTSHLGLVNDTIDANRATSSGPVAAGGLFLPDGATTIHNTIVVNNRTAPSPKIVSVLHNCWVGEALLASLGWNLADDTTCNLTHTGDQLPPSANAALGTLQDNGGVLDGANGATSPTLTQALGHGSTALDMADPTTFPATDERDVTRPQLAPASLLLVASSVAHVSVTPRADIGAYEAAQVVTSTPTPTPGISTPNPTPRSGVQGIISVPKTGVNPDETLPLGATLAIAGLLSVATGAFLARRRRR